MRKRTLAIIIVLVLIGSIFVASNLQMQTIGGVDIDTNTQIWRTNVWRNTMLTPWEYEKVVTGTRVTDEELLDEEYITSWLDDGRSEKISLDNTFFRMPDEAWLYRGGWWQVDVYKDGQWENIFDDNSYDDDYVCDVSGHWGLEDYSDNIWIVKDEVVDPFIGDCTCNRCGDAFRVSYNGEIISEDIHFDGLSFRLKGGGYNGYLRVRYIFDGYIWNHEGWNCQHKNGLTVVEDFARLKTGEGDIRIQPNPEAPSGASEYFEEGHEVTFEINTGYDGSTGTNWVVFITDNNGDEVAKTVYDKLGNSYTTPFSLKNGLADKEFSYTVQDGEWVSGDENRWEIHLYNSIMEKDREDWYVVYKGAFNDLPGLTDVVWLSGDPRDPQVDYYLGDTIQLRTSALPNQNTQKRIEKFEVWAYINNKVPRNVMYHGYEPATAYSGDSYSATFEIPVTKEGPITVEARAWDELLPGGTNIEGVYILPEDTQDFYDLYILVVNNKGEPVSDALVEISNEGTLRTGADGEAMFANMPEARYEIQASYPGLGEGRTVIYLDSNRDITLELGSAFSIINIVITVLISAISILAIWFIPHPLVKKFRIPLTVVILLICVFIYLFLSGMLVFIT